MVITDDVFDIDFNEKKARICQVNICHIKLKTN